MGKYNISGIRIEFNYLFDEYFKDKINAYAIDDNEKVDYLINITLADNIDLPNLEPYLNMNSKCLYKFDDNNLLLCFFNKEKSKVNTQIYYRNDYSTVEIQINKNLKIDLAELEYVVTGLVFLDIASINGFIPIHASAISLNNSSIIFSAPSGTGKSTHANLWLNTFENAIYINDDKPLISIIDEKIEVVGTPWSGKNRLNNNIKSNLKAIVFLKQSKTNSIVTLDNTSKLVYLLRNIYRPVEKEIQDIIFEKLNILISKIPMYELSCDISKDAVLLAYKKIFEGEVI